MNIELNEIAIRDLYAGYVNDDDNGVVAYGGKLDIRPKYQREFIYKPAQQVAVIDTILKGFPLNVMYWAKREDGTFEVMDGQQRTLSICSFLDGDFSIMQGGHPLFFNNLPEVDKEKILNYKLMVYLCDGNDAEKLEWFKTINIAGEELTLQELRNAVYAGPWTIDAKKHFSKFRCAGYGLAEPYFSGEYRRQALLETALSWIADQQGISIEEYMAHHQHDSTSNELWLYFQSVINWVKATFPKTRKEMKSVQWGPLFNRFGTTPLDPSALEDKVAALMIDDDVTRKPGIYEYVLDGKEKHLSIRAFSESMKRAAYEKQHGLCPMCKKKHKTTATKVWKIEEMEADHIKPWHEGGTTTAKNCQMLCRDCNREKGGH